MCRSCSHNGEFLLFKWLSHSVKLVFFLLCILTSKAMCWHLQLFQQQCQQVYRTAHQLDKFSRMKRVCFVFLNNPFRCCHLLFGEVKSKMVSECLKLVILKWNVKKNKWNKYLGKNTGGWRLLAAANHNCDGKWNQNKTDCTRNGQHQTYHFQNSTDFVAHWILWFPSPVFGIDI